VLICFLFYVSSNRDLMMHAPAHVVNAKIAKTFIGSDAFADFDVIGAGVAVGSGVAGGVGDGAEPDIDAALAVESGGFGG